MANLDSQTEKKLWLETISKQVDREINRRRSSSVTSLAFFGLIIGLLYRGLTHWLPTIYVDGNLFSIFLFSSVFINLGIILALVFSQVYKKSVSPDETRLFPEFGKLNMGLVFCSLAMLSLSGLLLNSLSAGLFFMGKGPFIAGSILSVFWLLTFLTFSILWIFTLLKKHSSFSKSIFYSSKSPLNKEQNGKRIRIILYIIAGATIFILISKFPTTMDTSVTNNLTVSAEFILLHFVLLISMWRFGIISKESLMEDLERKVLMDKIPANKIRKEYEMILHAQHSADEIQD